MKKELTRRMYSYFTTSLISFKKKTWATNTNLADRRRRHSDFSSSEW